MKRFLTLYVFISFSVSNINAQGIDFLRSTGKMYGVYAVVMVLFIGLIMYLFSLDRKISKIEKSIGNE